MVRWRALVLGALTFFAAHAVLLAGWAAWFEPGGAHPAWFLNSGRAMAFTAGCLLAGGALAGALRRATVGERVMTGAAFALGAVVAMIAVLFNGDAGTIVPLVLFVGACVALTSGVAGAIAGGVVRAALSRR